MRSAPDEGGDASPTRAASRGNRIFPPDRDAADPRRDASVQQRGLRARAARPRGARRAEPRRFVAAGKRPLPLEFGLTLTVDQSASGSRVRDVVSGQPLDPDRIYSVAISDFILKGGDDYVVQGPAGDGRPKRAT